MHRIHLGDDLEKRSQQALPVVMSKERTWYFHDDANRKVAIHKTRRICDLGKITGLGVFDEIGMRWSFNMRS